MKSVKETVGKLTVFDRYLVVFLVIGFAVVVFSLVKSLADNRSIEIVEETSLSGREVKIIMVDVSGAVLKPGVYELAAGSRYKDAFILAGGFSSDANREFVEKQMNLAEILKDGQKIYVPHLVDTTQGGGYVEAKNPGNFVNVNTASISQLDTLWGIGKARAENIVKNRPYRSLDEMVGKGAITKQILEKNRHMLTVY